MPELQRRIREVRRRLNLFLFFDTLLRALLVASVVGALWVVLDKTFAASMGWQMGVPISYGVAILAAGVWFWTHRISDSQAAMVADERLGLRERLSSALMIAHAPHINADAKAALERDAVSHAQRIQTSRDFRYRAPRGTLHLLWPVLLMIGAMAFMPNLNLMAGDTPEEEQTEEQVANQERLRQENEREVRRVAREARQAAEDARVEEMAQFAARLERLADDLALRTKDDRAAIAELSRLNDEVRAERDNRLRDKDSFRQIRGMSRTEETRDLQRDLKDQKFQDAAEALKQLAQELENMDAQRMADTARDLEALAEQVKDNQQMSEALKSAAEALSQAAQQQQAGDQGAQQQQGQQDQSQRQGGDQGQGEQGQDGQQQPGQQGMQQQGMAGMPSPQLAQAMEQLQQAAQSAESLQEAMDQVQQLDNLQQQMDQVRNSMMNQQSESPGPSEGGQRGSSGQEQGSSGTQGEQGQQQNADGDGSQQGSEGGSQGQEGASGSSQASGQGAPGDQSGAGQTPGGQQGSELGGGQQPCPDCGGGDCSGGQCSGSGDGSGQGQGQGQGQGDFSTGDPSGQGGGSGGPGQGSGEVPMAGLVDVDFEDTMVRGEVNEGEIIAVIEIDAPAARGESTVQYRQVYQTQAQRAADSLRQVEIPLGYRNAVRDYFEAINPERRPQN